MRARILVREALDVVKDLILPLVAIPLIPLFILVKLALKPFERPITRTPSEVAEILRGFLGGTTSCELWDDFICIPIADPALEAIRKHCLKLPPPWDASGDMEGAGRIIRAYIEELERAVEQAHAADEARA